MPGTSKWAGIYCRAVSLPARTRRRPRLKGLVHRCWARGQPEGPLNIHIQVDSRAQSERSKKKKKNKIGGSRRHTADSCVVNDDNHLARVVARENDDDTIHERLAFSI